MRRHFVDEKELVLTLLVCLVRNCVLLSVRSGNSSNGKCLRNRLQAIYYGTQELKSKNKTNAYPCFRSCTVSFLQQIFIKVQATARTSSKRRSNYPAPVATPQIEHNVVRAQPDIVEHAATTRRTQRHRNKGTLHTSVCICIGLPARKHSQQQRPTRRLERTVYGIAIREMLRRNAALFRFCLLDDDEFVRLLDDDTIRLYSTGPARS